MMCSSVCWRRACCTTFRLSQSLDLGKSKKIWTINENHLKICDFFGLKLSPSDTIHKFEVRWLEPGPKQDSRWRRYEDVRKTKVAKASESHQKIWQWCINDGHPMYNSHVNKENLGVRWLHHIKNIKNLFKPDFWSIKSILHFKTIHSCVEICGFRRNHPCEKMQGFEESSMSNGGGQNKSYLRNPVVLTGKNLIRLSFFPPQGNPTSTFRSKSSSMLILTWQIFPWKPMNTHENKQGFWKA